MALDPNEIETICKCECTLTLSGENMAGARETKDNFNEVPSMHEIDEEDSEAEENASTSERQSTLAANNGDAIVRETKDMSENESAYMGESFCSDESSDESSEITNVTSESLVSNPSSLLRITETGTSEWNDDLRDEFYTLSEMPPCVATMNRFVRTRKCRRWNMSFTDEEMRRIERENELLLRRIMAQQQPRQKILGERTIPQPRASSAINRRKFQKKIQDDNMLLRRRLLQTKSRVLTNTPKIGCRLTFL